MSPHATQHAAHFRDPTESSNEALLEAGAFEDGDPFEDVDVAAPMAA